MTCQDNVPDTSETTHQKPDEKPKEKTPEQNFEISEQVAKGQPTESEDG